MANATVFYLLPECEVCGQRMHDKFLRPWNEKRVCVPCITALTAEFGGQIYADYPAPTPGKAHHITGSSPEIGFLMVHRCGTETN